MIYFAAGIQIYGYANEDEMVQKTQNKTDVLGGVVFYMNDSNTLSTNVTYKIRLSSSPRNANSGSLDPEKMNPFLQDYSWMTNLMFPLFPMVGPREKNCSDGGTPGQFVMHYLIPVI